jgi:XTP/dITP diphosphohydrolase
LNFTILPARDDANTASFQSFNLAIHRFRIAFSLPMKILLASRNRDKYREIAEKIKPLGIALLSPDDFKDLPEVEEDGATLQDNAYKKAVTLHRITGLPALADDTGLEVEVIGGAPGVYSSRYAGPNATYADNVAKLLNDLRGVPFEQRKARFRCVIAFLEDGYARFFEGGLHGYISLEPKGQNGFGYDPIFYLPAEKKTLAELSLKEKNRISHRGLALEEWLQYLRGRMTGLDRSSR